MRNDDVGAAIAARLADSHLHAIADEVYWTWRARQHEVGELTEIPVSWPEFRRTWAAAFVCSTIEWADITRTIIAARRSRYSTVPG